MTSNYVENQLSQLQNDDDNKAAIQLRGSEGGKTKWLSITNEQLEDIKSVLMNNKHELSSRVTKLSSELNTCNKVFHDTELMRLQLAKQNKNLKTIIENMMQSQKGFYHWKSNMGAILEEVLKDE